MQRPSLFTPVVPTCLPTLTDVSSVLITGELPERHQVVFWTTGTHQAVYVPNSRVKVV